MKKIIFIAIMSVIITACGSFKSLDLNKLTTGMTKQQVIAEIGHPDRVLAVNEKDEGRQEVLEYRTSRNEVYALEFWNDYLTGYEFLYDDVNYIPPYSPPMIWPDYGRPVYIINNSPNRPNQPNRPSQPARPTQPGRPGQGGSNTSRPNQSGRPGNDNNRPTARPDNSRPIVNDPVERPTTLPETTRPSTSRPSQTDRPTSRPTSSGRSSSSSEKESSGSSTRSSSGSRQ